MERGVRLTLAYDGAQFAGFAAQPDQRTVQGVVAQAIERVCGHPVEVRGASRTDAGVHALGQVVAFTSARELAPERWRAALNRYLPEDVAVREVSACAPDYNPRFDARHKTYRYLFHLASVRDPLLRGRAWHPQRLLRRLPHDAAGLPRLDLAAMREACVALAGSHDFRAFRAAADPRENTMRRLLRLELIPGFAQNPALLAFEVQGEAFMLNMVRILAGTLIDIGRGRLSLGQLARLLERGADRADNPALTAPAHGLTLVEVCLGKSAGTRADNE